MTLVAGTKPGPYEILSALGAAGNCGTHQVALFTVREPLSGLRKEEKPQAKAFCFRISKF
jgi:hypothetical protein